MKRLVCLLFLVASPLSAALADVPSTMSYQGVLTDAGGILVPDGNYNLTFRIYNVAVGGAALYTENHPAVPVQLGGFSVIIGSTVPIGLPFDTQYWLGIQVGADPELTPRVALAASPYGLSLRLPFAGSTSSAGPAFEILNGGTGPAIRGNVIDAGTPSAQDGRYRMFSPTGPGPTIQMFNTNDGSRLWGLRSDGARTFQLEEDFNGSGGFFSVYRTDDASGFTVDGSSVGSGEPLVGITGSTESAFFRMAASGDASVILPSSSVAAAEIADEPGIGHANASSVSLTSSNANLLSRTITCPTAGYVVVLGSTDIAIGHTSGTGSITTVGVSNASGTLPPEQDFQMNIPSGAPSGTWDSSIGAHGVFSVTAGVHTFYFVGRATGGGSSTAFDINLTVMFFPTAYGTVQAPGPQSDPAGAQEVATAASSGMTAADLAAERAESEAFNAARMQRDLMELRREVERLKLDVARNASAAGER